MVGARERRDGRGLVVEIEIEGGVVVGHSHRRHGCGWVLRNGILIDLEVEARVKTLEASYEKFEVDSLGSCRHLEGEELPWKIDRGASPGENSRGLLHSGGISSRTDPCCCCRDSPPHRRLSRCRSPWGTTFWRTDPCHTSLVGRKATLWGMRRLSNTGLGDTRERRNLDCCDGEIASLGEEVRVLQRRETDSEPVRDYGLGTEEADRSGSSDGAREKRPSSRRRRRMGLGGLTSWCLGQEAQD